jgi:broad specificity phosphatase PhoE
MWSVEPLVLTDEDRSELGRRVRALTTPHRDRQRAQVVLLAASGMVGRAIGREVGLSPRRSVNGGSASVIPAFPASKTPSAGP